MIKSFRWKDVEASFNDILVPKFRVIERPARRKLPYLHRARALRDLQAPPGNRLEALTGNRKGQHGIRVDDKWRICLRWDAGNAYEVEIVDDH